MSGFKIHCPTCRASLKTSKTPRVGKEIECPQCATLFTIRADQVKSTTSDSIPGVLLDELLAGDPTLPRQATPTPPPAVGKLEPTRKKPTPAPASIQPTPLVKAPSCTHSSSRLWVGLSAAVFVLLIGAGAVAFYAFRKDPGRATDIKKDAPLLISDAAGAKDVKPKDTPKIDPKKEIEKLDSAKDDKSASKDSGDDRTKVETEKKDETKVDLPKKEPEPPIVVVIPGMEPDKVNRAVLRGAGFLKSQQFPTGTWSKGDHGVGYASLAGLTLLECKFPPKDGSIQAAAQYVRMNSQKLTQTYDLSLAVLFLDRLGESRDKPLIQGLALRLVAGQNERGGWDYHCPLLSPYEMNQLITYLQKTKQKVALQLPKKDDAYQPPNELTFQQFNQDGKGGKQPGDQPGGIDQKGKTDQPATKGQPYKGGDQPDQPPGKQATKSDPKDSSGKTDDPPKSDTAKMDIAPKKVPPVGIAPKILPKGKGTVTPVVRPDFLPPTIRELPLISGKGKAKGKGPKADRDDNSNSQFAILALWAARRHAVPTEKTLQLVGERYRSSQNGDGGWGYRLGHGSTDPMSCVGVLGLAMGIGTAPELPRLKEGRAEPGMKAKPALDDADVDRGLLRVARGIGDPSPIGFTGTTGNLYQMWSVERVAMMYDLKTIGGKDWYAWGAQMLVKTQNGDGSWVSASYPGRNNITDTCLALLFLKRSNLADDLTRNFQHFLVVRDPGER